MIPTINKPNRVTKKTATERNRIITNSFVDNTFKTATLEFSFSYMSLHSFKELIYNK